MPEPRRIRVVGNSGSGKSTLAAEISRRTGLPRLELDEVFWDAGWRYRDLDEAHALIDAFVAEHPEGWVIDGNWTSRLEGRLDPGTDAGADLVVWLDHPRPLVMSRVIRRTARRGILREELWHGNRERPSTWLSRDPHENIVLWSWTNHRATRERMTERMDAGQPVVRLAGRRAVGRWLATLR
ncbi:AAA family ATPase [Microbacterium aoyamense]|uniref:AAA family ATPase n=1 Tax=Microbacterium aoyamense TaxID=344166 RepID=A0ABP5B7B2_9MICO|nr:toxin [Microbacterium aoyamense]